ncbi:ABC transporter permease [Nocardia carnea]|uniref:ABC transporter permease n=1 Tax=Nocardia carnea TaxID=37328 RepID=UPI002453A9C6|nr:ABC transporter permease [Nocardia carnea]
MIPRALSIARIHTVAWPLLIAWPIGVLTVAFAISWTIFALVGSADEAVTGTVSAMLGLIMAFYLSAMTQTFPFALGLGVTRRDYFAATVLVGLAQILGFALMLWGLTAVEQATGGWGVNMVMFAVPAVTGAASFTQFGTFAAVLAVVAGIGLLFGAVHQRWRVIGVYTLGLGVLLLVGLATILMTWLQWWPEIGRWFADAPRAVPLVVLPVLLALGCLAGAWAVIRRATA